MTHRLLLLVILSGPAFAQVTPPNYENCRLESIYPAGGRRGESVSVTFQSYQGGIEGAREILIDGPPGIAVQDVKNVSTSLVTATFVIAADAAPGRRCVRVVAEKCGITNMLYFSVGRMPETLEKEPNNEPASAQSVTLPIVVNGRVDPKADQDCFAFELKKGQRLAAVVLAHSIDSHGQYRNYGLVDANLEILDARGRVVAEAGDTIGLDPQLEYLATADGRYTARVRLEAYEGFPQAIYRLVLAEAPLATSVFPAGGQRGTTVQAELAGPNIVAGTQQPIAIPRDKPMQHFLLADANAADWELPFVAGDLPECVEVEPNDKQEQAIRLESSMTANGRFLKADDVDWYRIELTAGQAIVVETTAQRFLRAPVDTKLEFFDPTGKKLAENDDGFPIDYISMHDFKPMDSRLVFKAASAGPYFVRVSNQSGEGGPRCIYRLTVRPAVPDFELFLYPDGVPVWGPGSTAAMLVKIDRENDFGGDIELRVEGLPTGWKGSETISRGATSSPSQRAIRQHFLTLTAPSDAKVGTVIPFRIVGRAKIDGRDVERVAKPVTLYYSSDTGFFRMTPQARAVVAKPSAPWLSTSVSTLSAVPGGTIEVTVNVHEAGKLDALDLNVDMVMDGVATGLSAPKSSPIRDGTAVLSLKLPDHVTPGRYGLTVSPRWRSDIRIGMPGPCTPLIRLDVIAPTPKK